MENWAITAFLIRKDVISGFKSFIDDWQVSIKVIILRIYLCMDIREVQKYAWTFFFRFIYSL